jgi:hypothetical protein
MTTSNTISKTSSVAGSGRYDSAEATADEEEEAEGEAEEADDEGNKMAVVGLAGAEERNGRPYSCRCCALPGGNRSVSLWRVLQDRAAAPGVTRTVSATRTHP